MNSDAGDFVMPSAERQAECIAKAVRSADLTPEQIDVVSTHATGTAGGDVQEAAALRSVFRDNPRTKFNNTKSFIGHAMGAAGALELAGNLPSFTDRCCHATLNLDDVDPECALSGIVRNQPQEGVQINVILNNSFGMLGINSAVIVQRI